MCMCHSLQASKPPSLSVIMTRWSWRFSHLFSAGFFCSDIAKESRISKISEVGNFRGSNPIWISFPSLQSLLHLWCCEASLLFVHLAHIITIGQCCYWVVYMTRKENLKVILLYFLSNFFCSALKNLHPVL